MAFGNAAAERAAIETTYEDTAAILRTRPETGVNNIAKQVQTVVYEEVVCALSKAGSDKSRQTEAQQNIDWDAVIFAPPELVIWPGDFVELKRFGRGDPESVRLLRFEVIGRPTVYVTHQEVKVKDRDLA